MQTWRADITEAYCVPGSWTGQSPREGTAGQETIKRCPAMVLVRPGRTRSKVSAEPQELSVRLSVRVDAEPGQPDWKLEKRQPCYMVAGS